MTGPRLVTARPGAGAEAVLLQQLDAGREALLQAGAQLPVPSSEVR